MNLATLTPVEVVAAWTSTIAVLSLVNKYIMGPYAPNVARLLSALISIPAGHIANVIEDLETLAGDINSNLPPPPPPANKNGTAPVTPPATPPSPPAAAALRTLVMSIVAATIAAIGLGLFGVVTPGCTPAQSAEMTSIESTILGDLIANKSQKEVEEDVATIVGGPAGADVVIVVDDALTLLIDSGKLTPAELTAAQTLLGQVHPRAMGHRALRDAK